MARHLTETSTDMPGIPTLDEAIDACDTLRRFLEGVDATFRRSRVQKPPASRPEPTESAGKTASQGNSKTATWPDRVRAILRDANEPLAAKDIITIYRESHDSGESSAEEIGKRLRSVLWQMKERGQLSHDKTTGKYQEKPT
jgi:hypothetical protein